MRLSAFGPRQPADWGRCHERPARCHAQGPPCAGRERKESCRETEAAGKYRTPLARDRREVILPYISYDADHVAEAPVWNLHGHRYRRGERIVRGQKLPGES